MIRRFVIAEVSFRDRPSDVAKRKTRQSWGVGDVFSIPQKDGFCCLGQIVDLPMPNAPSCALYDIRHAVGTTPASAILPLERVLSAVSTTADRLDHHHWKVFFRLPVALQQQFWPNEPARDSHWVGARTYGSGIVENFLDAYYGLIPWDFYKDPNYFDKLLFFGRKRPKNVIFKKK